MLLLVVVLVLLAAAESAVLLVGASGRLGRSVARKLVSQGVETIAIVRDPSRLTASQCVDLKGCKVVEGDVTSLKSLREAAACYKECKITSVVAVHGVKPPRLSKFRDLFGSREEDFSHPCSVNYKGVQNLLVLMKELGIPRIVRITGALVGKANNVFTTLFNLLLSFTVKYHELSEIAIRASAVEYVNIRPTGIREEPGVKLQPTPCHLECVSPDDPLRVVKLPGKISIDDLSDLVVSASVASPSNTAGAGRLQRATLIVSTSAGLGPTNWSTALTEIPAVDKGPLLPGPHTRNAVIALCAGLGLACGTLVGFRRLASLVLS